MGTMVTWPVIIVNSVVSQFKSLHHGPYSDKFPLFPGLPGTIQVQASVFWPQSHGSSGKSDGLFLFPLLKI